MKLSRTQIAFLHQIYDEYTWMYFTVDGNSHLKSNNYCMRKFGCRPNKNTVLKLMMQDLIDFSEDPQRQGQLVLNEKRFRALMEHMWEKV